MEFQKQGILFGLARGGRCLLGDEMGLGKTLQALAPRKGFASGRRCGGLPWCCSTVVPRAKSLGAW